MLDWIYVTAFLVGLLGSAHCFGMCGGIAAAYAPSIKEKSLSQSLLVASFYNFGRALSYAIAGAIAGSVGVALGSSLDLAYWSIILRFIAGLIIILIGLQLLFKFELLAWVESIGKPVWEKLAPLTRHLLPLDHPLKWLALGGLWGWLPCGMVYSMLLMAVTSGGSFQGAALMLCFALGTLPSMMLTGVTLAHFGELFKRKLVHQVAGGMCIIFGIWTAGGPMLFMASGHDHHAADASHHHHHEMP